MKKLKRFLMGMTGVAAVCVGLSGCGEKDKAPQTQITVKNKEITTEKKTDKKKEKVKIPESATIEETVLVDQDGVKITAEELTYTGNTPKLKLLIENTSDQKVEIYSGTLGYDANSVNGYMFPGMYVNAEVTPGNKATENVSLNYELLQLYGIKEIGSIQMGFYIQNDDFHELFRTEPIEVKTSAYEKVDFQKDTFKEAFKNSNLMAKHDLTVDYMAEENVYDDGGVTVDTVISVTNAEKERNLFVEGYNKGKSPVAMVIGNIEINDIVVCDSRWNRETINPERHAVETIDLKSLIKNSGAGLSMEDIQTVTFKVSLEDENGEKVAEEQEITATISDKGEKKKVDGKVLYNEGGIKVTFIGNSSDNTWEHYKFHVENTSGVKVDLRVKGFSVNHNMADVFAYAHVEDGKTGCLDIKVSESDFEKIDVKPEDVTEAELTLEIKDKNYETLSKPTIKVPVQKEE